MEIRKRWIVVFFVAILFASATTFVGRIGLLDLQMQAGDVQGAIDSYRLMLEKEPQRKDFQRELAHLLAQAGEDSIAWAYYEMLLSEDEIDQRGLKNLLGFRKGTGNRSEIIEILELLAGNSETRHDYLLQLADAYAWDGRNDDAIALYVTLRSKSPRDASLTDKLLQLYYATDQSSALLALLEDGLEYSPENLRWRKLRADLFLAQQQKPQAIAEFEHLLKYDPDDLSLRLKIAGLYEWNRQPKEAIRHYKTLLYQYDDPSSTAPFMNLTRRFAPDELIAYYRFRLQQDPENPALGLALINLLIKLGEIDAALTSLHQALKRDPARAPERRRLAQLYDDLQLPAEMVQQFERLLQHGHRDDAMLNELFAYYQSEKRYQKMLQLYDEQFAPGNSASIRQTLDYASVAAATDRQHAGIRALREALESRPESEEIVIALMQQQAIQDLAAALHQGDEFLQKKPQSERVLHTAATLALRGGQLKQAKKYYAQLATISPANTGYAKRLAECHIRLREYADALRIYKQFVNSKSSFQDQVQLARLHHHNAEFEQMEGVLYRLSKRYQNQADAHRFRANFYFESGLHALAIIESDAVLRNLQNDSLALRIRGLASAWQGDLEKGEQALSRYVRHYPGDYTAHFQLGEIATATGHRKSAAKHYDNALSLLHRRMRAREQRLIRARALARKGLTNPARQNFNKLLAEFPDQPEIYNAYAESMLAAGAYDEAGQILALAGKREIGDAYTDRLRGNLLFKLGDYNGAARLYSSLLKKDAQNTELRLALSDLHAWRGDYFNATQEVRNALNDSPGLSGAKDRLMHYRRAQHLAVSARGGIQSEQNRWQRQFYRIALAFASSSKLHGTMILEQDLITDRESPINRKDARAAIAKITARMSDNLRVNGALRIEESQVGTRKGGQLETIFRRSPDRYARIAADINMPWQDLLAARILDGRQDKLHISGATRLREKLYVNANWQFRRLSLLNGSRYGHYARSGFYGGYEWLKSPQVITFYDYQRFDFNQERSLVLAQQLLPPSATYHAFGITVADQLAGRLFYALTASWNQSPQAAEAFYYGALTVEWMLKHNLRLRGTLQSGTSGPVFNEKSSQTAALSLHYFLDQAEP